MAATPGPRSFRKKPRTVLDDSTLTHPIFTDGSLDQIPDLHRAAELIEAVAPLPSFITFSEPLPEHTLNYCTETGTFTIDGDTAVYATAEQAYDAVAGGSVHFGPGMDDPAVGNLVACMLILPPSASGSSGRTLIGHGGATERDLAVVNWHAFLMLAQNWLAEQDNWLHAYNFIQGHPAFWYRPQPTQMPHQWDTDAASTALWMCPAYGADGRITVLMEAGPAVGLDRMVHRHDVRLDVREPTVEAAYLAIAKLIHHHYSLDGTERPAGHALQAEAA